MAQMNVGGAGRHARCLCVLGLLAGALAAAGCGLVQSKPRTEPVPVLLGEQHARFAAAERGLRSPDGEVRRQAAVALLSMDYPPALPAVLSRLRSAPDAAERISMIQAVAFCADRRGFDAVLSAVGDADPSVRREAAVALTRFTQPEDIDDIVKLVGSADASPQQRALLYRTLGDALAIRAVPVLLDGLRDPNEQARLAAWQALRHLSRRDLPAETAPWQEWWAANAYRTREDLLAEHLQALAQERRLSEKRLADLEEEKQELTRLIGLADGQTPRILLDALGSRHGSVRLYASARLAALDPQRIALIELSEKDYDILKKGLADEMPQVRRNVVRTIVRLEGPQRPRLLLMALRDDDAGVLTAAIEGVRSDTGPEAVEKLAELLTQSRYAEVRKAAAVALGKVGSADSVPSLLRALDDPEQNVRWFAVEALRKLDAVQAVPRISESLRQDGSARVRQVAAEALGELGQPAGVVALGEALGDRNEKVRESAAAALLDLAVDDARRMMVVAQKFRARAMPERAREVLGRLVERFADDADARPLVMQAYEALGAIEKEQGNLSAAAAAFEKLDALAGGRLAWRKEMVECWVGADEAGRAASALERWLTGAEAAADKAQLVDLALNAAELMLEAGRPTYANAVLDAAADAAAAGADRRTEIRIEKLRRRAGG